MSAPRLTVPALDVRLGRAAQDVAVYKPTRCASRTSPPTPVFHNPVAFATTWGSTDEPDPATSRDTRGGRRPELAREACRDREGEYVLITSGAVSLIKH